MTIEREQPSCLPLLPEINDPPRALYRRGQLPRFSNATKFLCVVGSRKHTSYGADACTKFITELAGYPIVIVSGLALGIDSVAHEAALRAGLTTIAFPGSGLSDSVLYPKSNFKLAQRIIESGGCLLSEYEPDAPAAPWSFPRRNRLMAGASHAVLIIEGNRTSGTMITARLALDYNRDVLTLPGNITSPTAAGPNYLISQGATPVLCTSDILQLLGFERTDTSADHLEKAMLDLTPTEEKIVTALIEPCTRDYLSHKLSLEITVLNIALATLELKGIIRERLGQVERIM